MPENLVYAGAAIAGLWGVAHLIFSKPVLAGFEPLAADNRRVLAMEWIGEGVTLCFAAVLVVSMTALYGGQPAARFVDRLVAGLLVVMAVVSLFTGARASALPFKLCPFIFTASALLLIAGSLA